MGLKRCAPFTLLRCGVGLTAVHRIISRAPSPLNAVMVQCCLRLACAVRWQPHERVKVVCAAPRIDCMYMLLCMSSHPRLLQGRVCAACVK